MSVSDTSKQIEQFRENEPLFDKLINSPQDKFVDRYGVERYTWTGLIRQIEAIVGDDIGALLAKNNLSDVLDKAAARQNIGAISIDEVPKLPKELAILNQENNFTVRPKINGNNILSEEMAGLGVNQTWLNLTTSRTNGVTYTNTLGRPISVSISFTLYDTTVAQFLVNGVIVERFEVEGQLLSLHIVTINTIVPSGSTYRLNHLRGNFTINNWNELR